MSVYRAFAKWMEMLARLVFKLPLISSQVFADYRLIAIPNVLFESGFRSQHRNSPFWWQLQCCNGIISCSLTITNRPISICRYVTVWYKGVAVVGDHGFKCSCCCNRKFLLHPYNLQQPYNSLWQTVWLAGCAVSSALFIYLVRYLCFPCLLFQSPSVAWQNLPTGN